MMEGGRFYNPGMESMGVMTPMPGAGGLSMSPEPSYGGGLSMPSYNVEVLPDAPLQGGLSLPSEDLYFTDVTPVGLQAPVDDPVPVVDKGAGMDDDSSLEALEATLGGLGVQVHDFKDPGPLSLQRRGY